MANETSRSTANANARAIANLDLNLLYTLHSVVELGGVGAAARALGRTQPAISLRLKQLETAMGGKLLTRAGRGVTLTPLGRTMAAEVAAVIERVHGLLDAARASSREPVGILRIAALPTLSAWLLAPAVAELSRAHPRLTVEIAPGFTAAHLEALRRGEHDVVLSIGRPDAAASGVVIRELGRVRPCAILPAGSGRPRGSRTRRISLAELAKHPILHFGRVGDAFFDTVDTFLQQHGLERNVRILVPHIQSLQALVAAGAGLAIVPDYTVARPDLVRCRVDGLTLEHPVWVGVRETSQEIPAVSALLALLVRRLRAR